MPWGCFSRPFWSCDSVCMGILVGHVNLLTLVFLTTHIANSHIQHQLTYIYNVSQRSLTLGLGVSVLPCHASMVESAASLSCRVLTHRRNVALCQYPSSLIVESSTPAI